MSELLPHLPALLMILATVLGFGGAFSLVMSIGHAKHTTRTRMVSWIISASLWVLAACIGWNVAVDLALSIRPAAELWLVDQPMQLIVGVLFAAGVIAAVIGAIARRRLTPEMAKEDAAIELIRTISGLRAHR